MHPCDLVGGVLVDVLRGLCESVLPLCDEFIQLLSVLSLVARSKVRTPRLQLIEAFGDHHCGQLDSFDGLAGPQLFANLGIILVRILFGA